MIQTFDGHNDVLLRLIRHARENPEASFLEGSASGHLDLPRARRGGFVGGLFALYSPSSRNLNFSGMKGDHYDLPLPPPLELSEAREPVIEMLSTLLRIERASAGQVVICRDTGAIRSAISIGSLAVVIHIEGAEAIDSELKFLDILYACGLRSLGPVWSRPNIFGHGTPMRFPGSPDSGPGLTEAGERLVRRCNELGIMIDLSHITEAGFWDVARLTTVPLVATHSNVHAICKVSRNLTARQLDAIRDSGGIVGVNFATSFLRPDGQMRRDTPIDHVVAHIEALLERMGEAHVGIGSDFDGAIIPDGIGSVAGLQTLYDALRARGHSEELLTRIGSTNWLDVLGRTIG